MAVILKVEIGIELAGINSLPTGKLCEAVILNRDIDKWG